MCQIDWAMLLEYLKVIFSWPPLLALMMFWFIRRFASQVSEFITKINGVKLPGGSELLFAEKQQQQEVASAPEIPLLVSAEAVDTHAGGANLSSPSPTLEANGGPTINRTYSSRAQALYPGINLELVVDWMHRNPGPSLDDYVDKIFALHCERTFNIIFGTQVSVLIYLDNPALTNPRPGAAFVDMYTRHLELTGSSDRSLSEFAGFLVVRGLIENVGTAEGPLYQITEAGRQFLQHIKQHYPLHWNAKEF